MNIDNPIIQEKIAEILLIVNKLPLDSKETRAKFALKLLDHVFTSNASEAYTEEKAEEKAEEKVDEEKKLEDTLDNVGVHFVDNDGNDAINEDR